MTKLAIISQGSHDSWPKELRYDAIGSLENDEDEKGTTFFLTITETRDMAVITFLFPRGDYDSVKFKNKLLWGLSRGIEAEMPKLQRKRKKKRKLKD